MNNVVRFYT